MNEGYDIPLASAQVNWEPSNDPDLPPVEVVGESIDDDMRYDCSWGDCNIEFEEAAPHDKLQMLLAQFIHITVIDRMPVGDTFGAFRQIPEFRDAMHKVGWQE